MTRPVPFRLTVVGVVAMALVAAGCSRTTTTTSEALTGATDVPLPSTSAPAATSTTPATTGGPTSTSIAPAPPIAPTTTTAIAPTTTTAIAPTTTMPSTTTTRPPLTVADLTLASNGIMPYTFGEDAPTVVARLSEAFGTTESDVVALYPVESGDVFLDDFEETEYTFPIGRTVCWPDICAEFGGTTTDNLRFTGWSHFADGVDGLATAAGLTVGSTQADSEMTVYEGGCYSVGYGDADGIDLTLQSMGDPFVRVDDDGSWIFQTPDPADVEVIVMEAGERPIFVFADC